MSKKKVSPAQVKLFSERETVATQLAHLHEIIRSEVDLEPDEGDEQITEHETAAILVAILERKLVDIDAALASMEAGEYSQCERCNEPIEEERLLAKPDARYCLRCQRIVERILHQNQLATMPASRDVFAEIESNLW